MKTYHIEVTQADINSGLKVDCLRCPIARAMTRTLTTPCNVGCCGWGTTDWVDRKWPVACRSQIIDFIQAFDNGNPVKPFTFKIRA